MRNRALRSIGVAVAAFAIAGVVATVAEAASSPKISAPTSSPYRIALDARGKPLPFTVSVTGFAAGSLVFVEQCDGRATSADGWAPTRDCDLGTSPAAAIVDRQGSATFSADDRNHAFHPFRGQSPQGLFNCLTQNDASPMNGLPDFRQCQIRVSTNNVQSTPDQTFLSVVLGGSTASHSSGLSSRWLLVAPIVVLVGVVAGLSLRRRPARRR